MAGGCVLEPEMDDVTPIPFKLSRRAQHGGSITDVWQESTCEFPAL